MPRKPRIIYHNGKAYEKIPQWVLQVSGPTGSYTKYIDKKDLENYKNNLKKSGRFIISKRGTYRTQLTQEEKKKIVLRKNNNTEQQPKIIFEPKDKYPAHETIEERYMREQENQTELWKETLSNFPMR